MPIKPENKKRYPSNWKDIRAKVLERANNRCEFCGIENYSIRENGSRVVLTVAHLDHIPEHCEMNNLRALCQKCHLSYDAKHHAETSKITRKKKKEMEKCKKCFWNYNCPYYGGINEDEWTEEALADFEKCEHWRE